MTVPCFFIKMVPEIFRTLISSEHQPLSDEFKPPDSVAPGNSETCSITAHRPVEGAATEEERGATAGA